jgi:hypothetical protein
MLGKNSKYGEKLNWPKHVIQAIISIIGKEIC